MKKIIFILILISISACSSNEITKLTVLQKLVKCDTIPNQENRTQCIDMFIKDSLLIIFDQSKDKCIWFINKNTYNTILGFGEYGTQTAEFLSGNFIDKVNTNDSIIYFHDVASLKFKYINYKNILRGGNPWSNITSTRVPTSLYDTYSLRRIDESFIVAREQNAIAKGLLIYDMNSNESINVEFHPSFRNVPNKSIFYYGFTAVNPHRGVIVDAYRHIDAVNFYNLNGILQKSYSFQVGSNKRPEMSKEGMPLDETVAYANGIYETENYCYVLFINEPYPHTKPFSEVTINIVAFDWSGNICNVFEINNFADIFCVDEENKKIIISNIDRESGYANLIAYEYE